MARRELKLTNSAPMIGLVAQEVEEVFPSMVEGRGEDFRSVRYSELGPVLLEAVKELQDELEEKDSEIQELRQEKDSEIQELREGLEEKDSEIQELRQEKDSEIQELRQEKDSEIQELRQKSAHIEARLQALIDSLPDQPARLIETTAFTNLELILSVAVLLVLVGAVLLRRIEHKE